MHTEIAEQAGHFDWEGHRIAYTSYGEGERTVVLIHGLLLSQKMHLPLAREIAARGYRAITLDVLGHGASERPNDMSQYSMAQFGRQTVTLLDAIGVEDAVVLGTSLGANTALEAAVFAPDRIRGMVVEMPVLDNALLGCAIAFTPAMAALSFGEKPMKLLGTALKAVPTSRIWAADFLLDVLRQDPGPSAAVLNGLFFGEVAPHRDVRRKITTKTLIIGHRRDPVHPFSDALALADEIKGAKFIQASSMIELRVAPKRLTEEICSFVDDCFAPPKKARRSPARRAAA
jgi:pimeloyl-ACP methyl ester carboxylesterase